MRGIDLEVRRGEIFAFLGPNGAGKTTTISVLEGYLDRDGGEVEVLGEDPAEAGRDWRGRVGFVLQECRMEELLTVRETLEMYAGYYRRPRPVDETIELVGLAEKADDRAGQAVRRPAAPPRRRRRADRRRRAALPRRADDRVRPLGPPRRRGR